MRIQVDYVPALVLGGEVVPQHTVTDLVAYLHIVWRGSGRHQGIYALCSIGTHLVCQGIGGGILVHVPGLRYPLLGRVCPCVAVEYVQQEQHSGLLYASAQLLHILQVLARTGVAVLCRVNHQPYTCRGPTCLIVQECYQVGDNIAIGIQPLVSGLLVCRYQRYVATYHTVLGTANERYAAQCQQCIQSSRLGHSLRFYSVLYIIRADCGATVTLPPCILPRPSAHTMPSWHTTV